VFRQRGAARAALGATPASNGARGAPPPDKNPRLVRGTSRGGSRLGSGGRRWPMVRRASRGHRHQVGRPGWNEACARWSASRTLHGSYSVGGAAAWAGGVETRRPDSLCPSAGPAWDETRPAGPHAGTGRSGRGRTRTAPHASGLATTAGRGDADPEVGIRGWSGLLRSLEASGYASRSRAPPTRAGVLRLTTVSLLDEAAMDRTAFGARDAGRTQTWGRAV